LVVALRGLNLEFIILNKRTRISYIWVVLVNGYDKVIVVDCCISYILDSTACRNQAFRVPDAFLDSRLVIKELPPLSSMSF
jgi:hypothetical protein